MKKTLLSALLIGGVALFSGSSLTANTIGFGNNSDGTEKLTFRKPFAQKNYLSPNSSKSYLSSGKEWDESEVTGGGLFLNFGLYFPPDAYLNPYYTAGDFTYGVGFNFELGNYFRFAKIAEGKFGIGLRATWLSASFCAGSDSYTSLGTDYQDIYRATEISILRVGPQFGMALNEKMGLDVFYQLGYNLSGEFIDADMGPGQESIGISSWFQGVSHEIGAAFKYKVFSVGFGYRIGKLNNFLNYIDGKEYDADTDKKYSVSSFRLTFGFKF